MKWSQLNGCRIALLLPDAEMPQVLTGTVCPATDPCLASALRIVLDNVGPESGNPEFILQGEVWRDAVRRDTQHGCDYRIDLCETPSRDAG